LHGKLKHKGNTFIGVVGITKVILIYHVLIIRREIQNSNNETAINESK